MSDTQYGVGHLFCQNKKQPLRLKIEGVVFLL